MSAEGPRHLSALVSSWPFAPGPQSSQPGARPPATCPHVDPTPDLRGGSCGPYSLQAEDEGVDFREQDRPPRSQDRETSGPGRAFARVSPHLALPPARLSPRHLAGTPPSPGNPVLSWNLLWRIFKIERSLLCRQWSVGLQPLARCLTHSRSSASSPSASGWDNL